MPVLALTDRFDGRLTTVSMLLAWIAHRACSSPCSSGGFGGLLRPGAPAGSAGRRRPTALLLVAGTVGSTVLFLGSIPWVYHEAYAWAIPMALGLGLRAARGDPAPLDPRAWWPPAAFTTGAVLSRTTAGWAVAGAVLLTAVLLPRGGRRDADPHLWWKIYAAGLTPVAIGMAVNWAKFRHPYLFPIDQQVFTSLNQHRRDAIAANGGDLFSPNMIGSTAVNYFRPDGIRFTLGVPVHLPARAHPPELRRRLHRPGQPDGLRSSTSCRCWSAWRSGASHHLPAPARWPAPSSCASRCSGSWPSRAGSCSTPTSPTATRRSSCRSCCSGRPSGWSTSPDGCVGGPQAHPAPGPRRDGRAGGLQRRWPTLAAAYNTRALANPGPVLEDYVERQEQLSR